jgi:ABC-type nitrate/sulfonate/bicarbonate transport system substrate-binding protein
MSKVRILYRDYDRAPYLYVLRSAARALGLDVELTKAELGGRYPEFLAEGATDFLAENYWTLQTWRARGSPFVSVASTVTVLNETLLVDPSITSISELRGKRLAVRAVGPSKLIPLLWLEDNGLGGDVEPVFFPDDVVGRWGNWRKVAARECDAAFVTNLYAHEGLAAGLRALPIRPYGFLGNITLTTTEAFIDSHREKVQTLVAAMFEASRTFRNDPEKTMSIISGEPQRLMEVQSRSEMERIYDVLKSELSEIPLPSAAGIANTHRMLLDSMPKLAEFNPLTMWDFSFARAVLASRGSSS